MEIIFHSHANETHFHKKGCALGLILKVRVFGTRKWPTVSPSLFLMIPRSFDPAVPAMSEFLCERISTSATGQ